MTHNDTHYARLNGLTQELQEFKSEFNSLLTDLKKEICSKFENVNEGLNQLEENFKSNLDEQINESIMSVKDTFINSLIQDNSQLRAKVEVLEKKLNDQECYITCIDQYSRRNNI